MRADTVVWHGLTTAKGNMIVTFPFSHPPSVALA